MALPTSGPITSDDLQSEFNQTVGSPFDIEDYYRGGGIVPSTSGVAGGVAEVQSVDFSGTASNTFTTASQDEIVHIDLDSAFDSGVTDPDAMITTRVNGVVAVGEIDFIAELGAGLARPDDGDEFILDGTTYRVTNVFGLTVLFTPALLTEIPDGTEFMFPRPTLSTTYSFQLDTAGTAFSSTPITGSFADNQTATQALTALGTAITGEWAGTTASTVSTIPLLGMDITIDFSGITFPITTGIAFAGDNYLELRTSLDATLAFVLPPNTTYNSAAELVVAFPAATSDVDGQDPTVGTYTTTADGDTLRITSTDSFTTLDFAQLDVDNDTFAGDLVTTDNHSGDTTVLSGHPEFNRISIDTNQTADIAQTLVLTRNSGTASLSRLQAIHGVTGEAASSYTLTDYAGMEIAALTATSGETLTSILGRLETEVDDNTETPIDFTAQVFIDRLVMTAQAVGSLNPGMVSTAQFTVTVDHNGGDGDIAVSGFTRSTRGRDTLSNINANVPTSGAVTFDNYHGATFGDN